MIKKGKCYVFSYVNPDTDGVCSSIGYSYLARSTVGDIYTPVIFGDLNDETSFVLSYFHVDLPIKISGIDSDSVIVIVDTHHRNQLPTNIPFENVVKIIDHHPAGDMDAFPSARIQNEEVGAVATLITEMVKSASLSPETRIAGILASAILSNTLNFTAPSTSKRDRTALDWLQNYVKISKGFASMMFKARSNISAKSTEKVLLSDYKEFNIADNKIGISQLELTNLSDFIKRPDLLNSLQRLRTSLALDHLILNGIDILRRRSIVVAVEPETRVVLNAALGARFHGAIARSPRILQRKTDFVPQLKKLLEKI